MTHRTARERLFLEAARLPRDATSLEGDEGHAATLEASPAGSARLIRVFHEGLAVAWTFTVEAGEARPPFFPDDVPHLPEMTCQFMWDDQAGLNVRWSLPSAKERIVAMRERVAGLDPSSIPPEIMRMATAMQGASSKERKALYQEMKVDPENPVVAWSKEVFGVFAPSGLPEEVSAAVDRIAAFHAEAGWEVSEEDRAGKPSRSLAFRRGGAERKLHAISVLGITTIGLFESPVDAPAGGA